MQTQLNNYQQALQSAFNASGSPAEKSMLQTMYTRAQVLTTTTNTGSSAPDTTVPPSQ